MKLSSNKLAAYSASASIFLIFHEKGESQVIYHNIDPDSIIFDSQIVPIDFNDDGTIDLKIQMYFDSSIFIGSSSSSWPVYIQESIFISQFNSVVKAPGYPLSFGAANLQYGAMVSESAGWNSMGTINLFYGYEVAGAFGGGIWDLYIPYYNWFENNQFLGVKFNIGTETHYGWVRLSLTGDVLPILSVQDYAYEQQPDTPIEIAPPSASIVTDLILTDVTDYNNITDFKLTFHKAAYEETVSKYRVFLYKRDVYSLEPPTLSSLETLPSDRYVEIEPSGLLNYEVSFPTGMTSIDGTEIYSDWFGYRAIIVSMADGINSLLNNISLPSNAQSIELTSTQPAVNVMINDSTDNGNISDFIVEFDKAEDETGIAEYRVYLINLNSEVDPFPIDDSSYYVKVLPENIAHYTIHFDTIIKIAGDEFPILFQSYYASVRSVGDSVFAATSEWSSSIIYDYYYGDIIGGFVEYYSPVYFEQPQVQIDLTTQTSADIHVTFAGLPKYDNLKEYRVCLVPEESMDDFTNTDLVTLPWTNYFKITASEINLDTHLPADMLDVNGNPADINQNYVIMIGLSDRSIPTMYSISMPSALFNLKNGVLPSPNTIFVAENILYVQNQNTTPFDLAIYDLSGKMIAQYLIKDETTTIDLNYLPKGIYLVSSLEKGIIKPVKIFIGHTRF